MSRLTTITFLFISTLITACHDGRVNVGASAGIHYDVDDHHDHYDAPHIRSFSLIDSLGNNSHHSFHDSLTLDPYVDYGIFELFWDVSSFYDYTVSLYINDYPGLSGATLIGSDYCGPFEACDDLGMQVCEYTPDFYLGCGLDLNEASRLAQPVDHLLHTMPDQAFISLEVCPTGAGICEVDSLPVLLF